jgi:hypothetical protein
MKIIIDSREQEPFTFRHTKYSGVEVMAGALSVGDYSLAGLQDMVAVERKSLPDLVLCLGRERDRFEREMQRAAALDAFAVVIEAAWGDLAGGGYRSKLNPHAACQSVLAFACRHRIPFFFAGGRLSAEYVCWGFLRQYLETARRRWGDIVKAHGGDAA